MEIGSVLELDEYHLYSRPSKEKRFWLPFMDSEYRTVFFQSGRNVIEELLRQLKTQIGGVVLLPDFLCTTVSDAVARAGVEIRLYKISKDFSPDIGEIESQIRSGVRAVYIVHYFGKKLSEAEWEAICRWRNSGILVIEDITMSLLSEDAGRVGFGDFILGSIRKWLPVSDGGFVCSREHTLPVCERQGGVSNYSYYYFVTQFLKQKYLAEGESDKMLKEEYMSFYAVSTDELFSDYGIYPITELSYNYILNCDLEDIKRQRIQNYDFLYEHFINMSDIRPLIKREKGYVPFGMVISCEKRDALRQYLVDRDIYCNIHWNLSDKEKMGTDARILSKTILTIPCDQRYGRAEMEHIINTIDEWRERG